MSHDLFTVKGTRFAFPELPSEGEIDPKLFASLVDRRETILAEAAAAKFTKPVPPRPHRPPRRGKGTFIPKSGAPGATIEVDGRVCEIWAQARRKRFWVVDGEVFRLVDGQGHEFESLAPGAQRAKVVDGVAERFAGVVASTVVPAPPTFYGKPTSQQSAAKARRDSAEAWATATIAHALYPDVYPDPGGFEDRVAA